VSTDGGPAGERLDALLRTPERSGLLRGLMPPSPAAPSPSAFEAVPGAGSRRWGVPPRAAMAAVLVCLALAAGVLGRFALGGGAAQELVPVAAGAAPSLAGGAGATAGAAGPAGPADPADPVAAGADASVSPSGAQVLVHVVGAVRRPGVVSVPAGARVLDAVAAAGGALHRAELARVNLARPVVDGEQIRIPARGETVTPEPAGGAGAPGQASSGTAGGSAAGGTALIGLNTADAAALETLPGVGPVLAGRIVQWRTSNGRFTSVDELAEVQGIGERLLEGLRGLVSVS
jgi:competence protein ComEA